MTPARKTQLSQELSKSQRRSHQKPDQWDRIRLHLVDGEPLRRKGDQKLLREARIVWPLLCKGWPGRKLVKELIEQEVVSNETAGYMLISKTKRIFGDAGSFNPEAEKLILIEMVKEAYQKAKDANMPAAMAKCAKELRELMGVHEDSEMTDLYRQLALPTIVYTSDASVLQEPSPTEPVPYEEITDAIPAQ